MPRQLLRGMEAYDTESGRMSQHPMRPKRVAVKDCALVVFLIGAVALTLRARNSAHQEMARSATLEAAQTAALAKAEERRLGEMAKLQADCELAKAQTEDNCRKTETHAEAQLIELQEQLAATLSSLEAVRAELDEANAIVKASQLQSSDSMTQLKAAQAEAETRVIACERAKGVADEAHETEVSTLKVELATRDALLEAATYQRDTARAERDLAMSQVASLKSAASNLIETAKDATEVNVYRSMAPVKVLPASHAPESGRQPEQQTDGPSAVIVTLSNLANGNSIDGSEESDDFDGRVDDDERRSYKDDENKPSFEAKPAIVKVRSPSNREM